MAEPFNDTTTAPPGMSRWIRQHPVTVFVVLAYLISLCAVGIFLLARGGVLPQLFQVIGLLAKFGPSLAGLVVAVYVLGPPGLDDLLQRVATWRIGWGWGLMVLFGPLLLFGGSVGVLALLGVAVPSPGAVAWWAFFGRVLFHVFLGGGLGEELGWRGVMLPLLQARMSALKASLIIGVAWAFWHSPQFLIDPFSLDEVLEFIPFTVAALGLSVIFTWVYNSTRGSLFAVVVLHAAFNAAEWFITERLFEDQLGDLNVTLVITALVSVIAVALVLLYGPADLSRQGRQTLTPMNPGLRISTPNVNTP